MGVELCICLVVMVFEQRVCSNFQECWSCADVATEMLGYFGLTYACAYHRTFRSASYVMFCYVGGPSIFPYVLVGTQSTHDCTCSVLLFYIFWLVGPKSNTRLIRTNL